MKIEKNTRERPVTALRKQELLEDIAAYVDAHLTERVTLNILADHFGVSVSTITQLFQSKAGTTFHQFLTDRRLTAAKALILEGMPLEQVGKQVGYTDHSSFYRAFRQTVGMSPRDFKLGKKEN